MTDVSNESQKRREWLSVAGELAAILAGIAAVFFAVTGFLSFVANECEVGTPFLPELFVCFPPK